MLYKKSATENPEIYDILRNIQQKIIICNDKIKISRMIESTIHMYDIAKYIIDKYTNYKRNLVSLDYDDLIYYAKELLSNNHMKDWVLYKLDGGIKHLLVDEAQDTSPKQWQIIEAIMREFYSGDTASKEERTIFIVGDEKQSIYSFQGADVSNFSNVSRYIQDQMHKAQKQYKNIELESSYRSSSSILDVVAKVFEEQYNSLSKLQCHRKGDNGLVELWPLYGKDEEDSQNRLFWPLVDEMESVDHPYKKLAKDIAHYIKNYLASGIILPSTKEKVKPGDFMILIRRRNQLTHEIIAALKELQVPVSGIDRMLIMNHLSVQDIISIAKFTLLPYDDLNLASLLKSPIIGLDEEGLI
ncbi:MAG UNVERIFIED_CONTAM: UvrD-helicase domain-containing protein [Rickettsiaceae bacterium]